MIRLYTFVLYFMLPWAFLRLWWRGFRQPAYRRHWRERLGDVAETGGGAPVTWIHAVSVGEVRAAAPLVNALLQRHPRSPVLVTTTTPTGRETVAQLFGDRVRCCYLPWDLPFAIRRFLASVRVDKLIVLETELWPNLFSVLAQRGIPLYLVNARLSQRSFRGYRRIVPLARRTLACVTAIAAQSEGDARRFLALGAPQARVRHVGNLKYEMVLPDDFERRVQQLREHTGAGAPAWVAASTHPGEESIVLAVHRRLLVNLPDCRLWLVPRHPERVADVMQRCRQAGLSAVRYSGLAEYAADTDGPGSGPDTPPVIVVDVLGELVYLYGMAPVAFIGGSLVPRGGHNPLEALQAGCAVMTGRRTDNFADMYDELESAGGVTFVEDEATLFAALEALLLDDELRQRRLAGGKRVLDGKRGALAQTLALIDGYAGSESA